MVSIIPSRSSEYKSAAQQYLFAAKGSRIDVYGQCTFSLDFGVNKTFQYSFLITSVQNPTIGFDFLAHFNLVVDLPRRRQSKYNISRLAPM